MGAFWVERQAFGIYLYQYVFFDSRYYEHVNHYEPVDSQYLDFVRSKVPGDWITRRVGVWFYVEPSAGVVPKEGFKIHVSATPKTALAVLEKILPALVRANVLFKITVDSRFLGVLTSKSFPRGSSGKFVTIYPRDFHQFTVLIDELAVLTDSCVGPYILSDKRYKQSKVVFYRYGGFRERYERNCYGERIPVISCGSNRSIEDVRSAVCTFPDGIADPFPREESGAQQQNGPILLHDRYRIDGAIILSNAGGVYRATDLFDGSAVVLKEARPHIGIDFLHTEDAICRLRNERDILQRLSGLDCVPRLVEYFTQWEHEFLVTRFVPGFLLPSYQTQEDVGLFTARLPTCATVQRFAEIFLTLTENLIAAVEACHREGVIVGDLAPQNVIVDPISLKVTLVDFGGSYVSGHKANSRAFTPGFASPESIAGSPLSFADDSFALRKLVLSIVYPVQAIAGLSPVSERRLLKGITESYCLPSSVARFVDGLADVERGLSVQEIRQTIPVLDANASVQAAPVNVGSLSEIQDVIRGISAHIRRTAECERSDRLWPADYRIFSSHPLCLAYGAIGIALFLQDTEEGIPEYATSWIVSCRIEAQASPVGFFNGLAGIAWGLWLLGFYDRALEVSELIAKSEPPDLVADVYYGIAGIGLSELFLWHATSDRRHLDRVCQIADRLCANAQVSARGKCWPHPDGIAYNGLAHGGSGIALFLLRAYEATGEVRYKATADAGLEHVIAEASIREGCIAWTRFPGDTFLWPYWRSGTAGIGCVLLRFFALTRDNRYRDLALGAARYLSNRYTISAGRFNGLTGIGEFFVDVHDYLQDQESLVDAWAIAKRVLLFKIEKASGICFPGEDLMRISNDFGSGAAGVGSFFLRLVQQNSHSYLDGLRSQRDSSTSPVVRGEAPAR
jgi:serine/threonine protein kinase